MNRAPNAITNFLKDMDNMIKMLRTDSVIQADAKLSNLMNKLTNEFSMFTASGIIKATRWSEMVRVIEKFLESNPDAFIMLKVVARAATGIWDVFDYNNTLDVSRQQLKTWEPENGSPI